MTPAALLRHGAQLFVLTLAMAAVAAFADWPPYRQIDDGAALIKFSFSHRASRECRRLTPEELAKLPPNMRRPTVCPRERRDLYAELWIDGEQAFAGALPPTGFAKDGPSHVYRRFVVPAGTHRIVARLRDTPRESGFDHEKAEEVTLAPGQNLALDFRPERGFVFR